MTALEESIFADLLGAVKMVENGATSEQVHNFVDVVCGLWGRQTVAVFRPCHNDQRGLIMEKFEQEKQEAIEIAKGENGFTVADKMAYVRWLCDSIAYFQRQIAHGCDSADNTQRLAQLKELYRIYWTNYNIY